MSLSPREARAQANEPQARTDGQGRLSALPGSQSGAPAPGAATTPAGPPTRVQPADTSGNIVLQPSPLTAPAFMAGTQPGHGPRVSPPDPYEDLLTGLVGPAVWRRILTTESARAARHSRPVTVVLVELTGLDKFARRWGAETATTAVLAMSRALRASSRDSDYLARLDIGRFGLVLDQTDEIEAINCVERLRESCAHELRGAEEDLHVGFGWASPEPEETIADAVARASVRLTQDFADVA